MTEERPDFAAHRRIDHNPDAHPVFNRDVHLDRDSDFDVASGLHAGSGKRSGRLHALGI